MGSCCLLEINVFFFPLRSGYDERSGQWCHSRAQPIQSISLRAFHAHEHIERRILQSHRLLSLVGNIPREQYLTGTLEGTRSGDNNKDGRVNVKQKDDGVTNDCLSPRSCKQGAWPSADGKYCCQLCDSKQGQLNGKLFAPFAPRPSPTLLFSRSTSAPVLGTLVMPTDYQAHLQRNAHASPIMCMAIFLEYCKSQG